MGINYKKKSYLYLIAYEPCVCLHIQNRSFVIQVSNTLEQIGFCQLYVVFCQKESLPNFILNTKFVSGSHEVRV